MTVLDAVTLQFLFLHQLTNIAKVINFFKLCNIFLTYLLTSVNRNRVHTYSVFAIAEYVK